MTEITVKKKYCPECVSYLPSTDFRKSEKGRDGLSRICLKCQKEQVTVLPSDDVPNRKMRRREMKERRVSRYDRTYGLSESEWVLMLEQQGNVCAICKGKEAGKILCVDHDHITGKVRGLLCNNCNIGLGNFKDNPKILVSAIGYLQEAVGVEKPTNKPEKVI